MLKLYKDDNNVTITNKQYQAQYEEMQRLRNEDKKIEKRKYLETLKKLNVDETNMIKHFNKLGPNGLHASVTYYEYLNVITYKITRDNLNKGYIRRHLDDEQLEDIKSQAYIDIYDYLNTHDNVKTWDNMHYLSYRLTYNAFNRYINNEKTRPIHFIDLVKDDLDNYIDSLSEYIHDEKTAVLLVDSETRESIEYLLSKVTKTQRKHLLDTLEYIDKGQALTSAQRKAISRIKANYEKGAL